jgi:hypothetical protein
VSSLDFKNKTTLILLCNWFHLLDIFDVRFEEAGLDERKLDDPEQNLGTNTIQRAMIYYFNENKYTGSISN